MRCLPVPLVFPAGTPLHRPLTHADLSRRFVPRHPRRRAKADCAVRAAYAPRTSARLGNFYAPDAQFKDPFNDVRGVPAITQIFARHVAHAGAAAFVVTQHLVQGEQAFPPGNFAFACGAGGLG